MAFVVKQVHLEKKTPDHNEEWRTYQPGVKLLLRGLNHDVVRVGIEMMQSKQQGIFMRFEAGDIAALSEGKTQNELNIRMLGELVIADWEGFELEDGSPVEFTTEVATKILAHPDNADLVVWAVAQAKAIGQAAAAELEGQVGKPSSASAGKRSGGAKQKSSS